MKKFIFSLVIKLSLVLASQAQVNVAANVIDYKQQPQTNIMVYLDTVQTKVKVNNKGFFKLKVPETTQIINIYSPTYGLLSSPYNGETKMSFVFLDKHADNNNGEVVTVDYSDLVSNEKNGNDTTINVEDNKDITGYNNIYDYLRGKVPGVNISANNKISIRGVKSLSGFSEPLIVVDGFPINNIDYIDVNNIKDIKILKDGAAIYGARGANGVLVITLKK